MFYKQFKGTLNAAPVVAGETPMDKIDSAKWRTDIDPDLRNAISRLPEISNINNEIAFFMDSICHSFAYMVVYTFLGKGFRIKCEKNKDVEDRIRKYNRHINVRGQTIKDYIVDTWIDNIIYNKSLWRIAKNVKEMDDEQHFGPDIQRVAPDSFRTETDSIHGWRKFIQSGGGTGSYKTVQEFLKGEGQPVLNTSDVVIPDDQHVVIYTSFFKTPPMATVLPYVTLKLWILHFIRKLAEKTWSPYIFGYIGDPKSGLMPQPTVMKEAISATNSILAKLRNFSYATFPGDTRVEIHEPKTNGNMYIDYLDIANREIMFGLFSSISVRESNGVFKENEIADEATVHFMEGIRDIIETTLKRFYVLNLTPEIDEDDLEFVWPELRMSNIDNMIKGLAVLITSGVFKDARERRRAAAQIFPFLSDKDVTDEDVTKLDKQFVTLQAPSQPGVTSAQAAEGGYKRGNAKT